MSLDLQAVVIKKWRGIFLDFMSLITGSPCRPGVAATKHATVDVCPAAQQGAVRAGHPREAEHGLRLAVGDDVDNEVLDLRKGLAAVARDREDKVLDLEGNVLRSRTSCQCTAPR